MTNTIKKIACMFPTENALYLAYMPFVKNGGLFIRTAPDFEIGESLFMSISILNEPEPIEINAKIIWITPKGAQGNKPAGIGVQFDDALGPELCHKIETHLAGMLKSKLQSDTV